MKNIILIVVMSVFSLSSGVSPLLEYATRVVTPQVNRATNRFYAQASSKSKLARFLAKKVKISSNDSYFIYERVKLRNKIKKIIQRIENPPFYTKFFPKRFNEYLYNRNQKKVENSIKELKVLERLDDQWEQKLILDKDIDSIGKSQE